MQPFISSPKNQRIKDAVRLRSRRGREVQGHLLIDGIREIRRALESGVELVELFYCDQFPHCEDAAWTLEQAKLAGTPVVRVAPQVIDKLRYGDRSDPLVAVARRPDREWAELVQRPDPLVAVLEQVEKPGNVGAVVRSAEATGIDGLIVADGGTDLYNPNTIRASLGTIFQLPVVAATTAEALGWIRDQGLRVLAARVEGAVPYDRVDYRGPVALVLGSESKGLSEAWRGDDVTAVSLPMLGVGDSLNVSVTAAVLFYEALRQRRSGLGA